MDCMEELTEEKKPFLCCHHKAAYLQYAKQHLEKPQNFWNIVIWSDETKSELYSNNHKCYVWLLRINSAKGM